MKKSITQQMVIVFVGLLAFVFALVLGINTGFLERFYIMHKQRDLIGIHQTLKMAVNKNQEEQKQVESKLSALTEKENISLLVIGPDGKLSTVVDDSLKYQSLYFQLLSYVLQKDQENRKVLKVTDDYVIYQTVRDTTSQPEYLTMMGELPDSSRFVMRTPLDSIRENAGLANTFLIYIGVIASILGGILVWIFARRISDPIKELAELSKRMTKLDFDARYTSGGENEIGVLGNNFNIMSEHLEKTISELKCANNQLQEDIEEKEKVEKMRNEFLGNVSHELKTPIALIQGYAEGLKEGILEDPESKDYYCDVIIDEAAKMNKMVKNLLILNQLEFGDEVQEYERFDLTGLIKGVLSSCELLFRQAEAKVDFIADETVYVWADEFKTEQVLRNYITNAIHHVDNEKRIEIRVISKGEVVRVSVFNSGKQIPEEDLPKLWDKFYKVDKAHTRMYGGNGIGLSIVKAIMESFHREYGVKNFDNGVQFWFELDACVLKEDCQPLKQKETKEKNKRNL